MTIAFTELVRLASKNATLYHCLMAKGTRLPQGILEVSEADYAACKQARGLGDIVATVAKPIARVIDSVAGTDLEHCGGCAQRQAKLNALFPLAGKTRPAP